MRSMLSQDIELTFESFFIEFSVAGRIAVSVMGPEDDKWLEDGRLSRASGRTEDRAIGGDFTPAKDAEAEIACDIRKDCLVLFLLVGVCGVHEEIADGILTNSRKSSREKTLGFCPEKFIGDARHYAGSIAVTGIRAGCSSVSHCAQKVASIRDDFVRCFALDMTDEADAACVSFILVAVEASGCREGLCPRLWIVLDMGLHLLSERRRRGRDQGWRKKSLATDYRNLVFHL